MARTPLTSLIHIKVTDEMRQAVMAQADREEVSANHIIRKAITSYLQQAAEQKDDRHGR